MSTHKSKTHKEDDIDKIQKEIIKETDLAEPPANVKQKSYINRGELMKHLKFP